MHKIFPVVVGLAALGSGVASRTAQALRWPPARPLVRPATSAHIPGRKLGASAGVIWGTVTDTRGRPLKGATITVSGTTTRGGERTTYRAETDERGSYSLTEVALGRYYITGMYETTFQGEVWYLRLHPTDNSNREVSTASDVHKDFVWALSGAVPGMPGQVYGVEVAVGENSIASPPDTFLFEIFFTPIGPLIDNSRGEILRFRGTWQTLTVSDVPVGPYRVETHIIYADGRRYPLWIAALPAPGGGFCVYDGRWQTSVNMRFEPKELIWANTLGSSKLPQLCINTQALGLR